MNILLSFAPFIVFAVLLHFGQVETALASGAIVAGLLALRDRFILKHSFKLLEIGAFLLFVALALYTAATHTSWTIPEVRFVVDLGLLLIVAGSLAVGRPFTLQYAREEAPPSTWNSPLFISTSRRIAIAWLLAFVALVAADAAMIWLPHIPIAASIAVTVVALFAAYKYTARASQIGAAPHPH